MDSPSDKLQHTAKATVLPKTGMLGRAYVYITYQYRKRKIPNFVQKKKTQRQNLCSSSTLLVEICGSFFLLLLPFQVFYNEQILF